MARIRTIKPEFPQSESMGRVSRDARLTFIMLWTIADDSGRLRGNSRMLASLLFPYDNDANKSIDKWLRELEAEGCITRYVVGSDSYVQINGWLNHQKIDKPSASKLPPPDEASRAFANPREPSALDQGRDQGRDQGEDQGKDQEGKGPGVVASVAAPPGLDHAAWTRWISYRSAIKKPLKPESQEAAMRKLAKYGNTQAEVVEQTIANGWQGLFPPSTGGAPVNRQEAIEQRNRAVGDEWLRQQGVMQ